MDLDSWRSLFAAPVGLVWLPRLTTGIFAITKVRQAKRVIVPNNCCLNVVYAILLAGAEPVFCEINIRNGSLSVDACHQLLVRTGADMVIHIHSFGIYSDRRAVYELCRRFGAFYFEDGASWFPPVPHYEIMPGSCLGLSFGHAKIFPLGGGGLLQCAEASLTREVERCVALLQQARGQSDYDEVIESVTGPNGMPNGRHADFTEFAFRFSHLWIGNTGYFAEPPSQTEIDVERRRRERLCEVLSTELSNVDIELLAQDGPAFPWRFSFLSKNELCKNAFSFNGVFVSRLFPTLDSFFPAHPKSESLENSRRLGAEIFNVSLDREITVDRIRQACAFYKSSSWRKTLRTLQRITRRT